MTIGERIKNRRIELGLSQEELAKRMGYKDRSTISYIEKNGRNLPLSKVEEFARVLSTTPSFLMGWIEEEQKRNTEQKLLDLFILYRLLVKNLYRQNPKNHLF